MEASFIIKILKEELFKKPATVPKENITGIVESPNISITTAPQNGLPVAAAEAAKKYTSPQGKNPFNIPSRKKLVRDLE